MPAAATRLPHPVVARRARAKAVPSEADPAERGVVDQRPHAASPDTKSTAGCPAGVRLAGITGCARLSTGIPSRDMRGTNEAGGRLRLASRKKSDLQRFYGSDGTRTRDLRRDRPVPAQPPQPAPTRNYRLEQAVRPRRTGCDRLRPARARQGLCSTCVVDVVTTSTTAGHDRSRDAVHSAAPVLGSAPLGALPKPRHWASASRWVGRRA